MRYATKVVFTLCYVGAVTPAVAAGYGLHEFSAQAIGTAFAGSASSVDDAGFLAYNPAASSGVGNTDIAVTAAGLLTSSSANYTVASTSAGTPAGGNSRPTDFVSGAVVPTVDLRTRLGNSLTAGLAIYAPWDLATNYPANSAERYYGETTKLLTANITPSLAYEISQSLTLSAGVQVEYAKGTLSNAVDVGTIGAIAGIPGATPGAQDATVAFTGVNWAFGYTLGALVHPFDGVTLGLAYISRISHDFNGTLRFQPDSAGLSTAIGAATGLFHNSGGSTKITTPDVVHAGATIDIAPDWKLLTEVDWTNWASFHNLTVTSTNAAQPADITLANWKATWMGSFGAEYRADDVWTLRAGLAYDPSPIPETTLSPRIPDGDRVILSAGASYVLDSASALSFAVSHLFVSGRSISLSQTETGNALRGGITGTTDASAEVLALQYSLRLD
jgi:long-chain fatty acid transport protein